MTLLVAGDPVERDLSITVRSSWQNLARESESLGFTCGGLDGRGFGVDWMLRRLPFACQEKINVVQCGRTCVIGPNSQTQIETAELFTVFSTV
jgi:hypothetical protein